MKDKVGTWKDLFQIKNQDITAEDRNESLLSAIKEYQLNQICFMNVFSIATPEVCRTSTGNLYRESVKNNISMQLL